MFGLFLCKESDAMVKKSLSFIVDIKLQHQKCQSLCINEGCVVLIPLFFNFFFLFLSFSLFLEKGELGSFDYL